MRRRRDFRNRFAGEVFARRRVNGDGDGGTRVHDEYLVDKNIARGQVPVDVAHAGEIVHSTRHVHSHFQLDFDVQLIIIFLGIQKV